MHKKSIPKKVKYPSSKSTTKEIKIEEDTKEYRNNAPELDALNYETYLNGDLAKAFYEKLQNLEKAEIDEFKRLYEKDIEAIYNVDDIKDEVWKDEKTLKTFAKLSLVSIYLKPEIMIRLNIVLNYHDVRIQDFLRVVIYGLLNEHPKIMSFFDDRFLKKGDQKRSQRIKMKRIKEKEIKEKYGLSPVEAQNLYDIMSEDLGF